MLVTGFGALIAQIRQRVQSGNVGGAFARGAMWSFLITVAGMGIGFLGQYTLVHILGAASYGVYVYILGWMNVILLFAKFEFDSMSIRFVSEFNGTQQWAKLRGFIRRSQIIVALLTLLTSLIGVAVVLKWPDIMTLWPERFKAMSPDVRSAALVACVILPFLGIGTIQAGVLQGLRKPILAQVPAIVARPLLIIAAVTLVWFGFGIRPTPAFALLINMGALILTVAVMAYLMRRQLPRDVHTVEAVYETSRWLKVGRGLLLVSVSQLVLSNQTDVVVVGSLLDTTQAGYYSIAGSLASLPHFIVTAVLFMVAPTIADLYARKEHASLQRLVTTVGRANMLLSLPGAIIMVILGKWVLGWFGHGFQGAYPVLLFLLATCVVNASFGSVVGYLLTMTGHESAGAWIIGGSAAVYVILAPPLTARYGAAGTAAATFFSFLTRAVALSIFTWRKLGINAVPFIPGHPKPVKA